jgi:glutathione S-transferase
MAASHNEVVEFFDIKNTIGATWSPNTALTRFVLNYKRIPHKTTWLSYPEIAGVLRSVGIAPASSTPSYTSPAIRHGATTAIMDSWSIALYLDSAFAGPDTPSVFPTAGALPLAKLVHHHLFTRVFPAAAKLALPKTPAILDDAGAEYFHRTRKEWFGKPLDELCDDPEAEWKTIEQEIAIVSDILSGRWSNPPGTVVERTGPFFLGDTPSYADFILASLFQWFKTTDEQGFERLMALGKEDSFRHLWNACEKWLRVEH